METFKLPKSNEQKSKRDEVLDESALKQMIRGMNLKVTEQRLFILKNLFKGRSHLTAQELFEIVHQEDKNIGFATVYRFLRDLTKSNIVTEVRMGGLPARYEVTPKNHHDHLSCIRCGKICEFENVEIEKLQELVAQQFGFTLTSHVLELYGICRDCK